MGSSALRCSLQLLVALNLLFVQLTGVVGWTYLGSLYALTLAAPLLARMHSSRLYRAIWDAAVILTFVNLLLHVSRTGLSHLLEDGLFLAITCQVHQLNNLNVRNRPDLLFLNSFLIALVTSYFSQDLLYLLLFFAHSVNLVIALELAWMPPDLSGASLRGVLRTALTRGSVLVAFTLAVFLFLPRDFERRGLLDGKFRLSPGDSFLEVGFSKGIDLGRRGPTTASDHIIFQARLERGSSATVSRHWRGATCYLFDGQHWHASDALQSRGYPSLDTAWKATRSGSWLRPGKPDGPRLRVTLSDQANERLFGPLSVRRLHSGRDLRLQPLQDGNLRIAWSRVPVSEEDHCEYVLEMARPREPSASERPRRVRPSLLKPYLDVLPEATPPSAGPLARQLRSAVAEKANMRVLVEHFRQHLASRYAYLPPGSTDGARDLEEFLSGAAGGHCEYFATALALLLRLEGVPCRMVTGFLAHEWDTAGQILTVRARDAHAWVEVFDPRTGWYPVDPTPAVGVFDAVRDRGWLGRIYDDLAAVWVKLLGFDEKSRQEVWDWLRTAPAGLATWIGRHPWAPAVIAALLVFVRIRRRAARRLPPAVRRYRRALRRARVQRLEQETPRECLAKAQAAELTERPREMLRRATREHERERYAGANAVGLTRRES